MSFHRKLVAWFSERRPYVYSLVLHLVLFVWLAHLTLQGTQTERFIQATIEAPREKQTPIEPGIKGGKEEDSSFDTTVKWKSPIIPDTHEKPILITSQPNDVMNRLRARDNANMFESIDLVGNTPGAIHDFGKGTGIGDGFGKGSNKMFGMDVHAQKLGIILDISGSMFEILPKVGAEIRMKFPDAKVIFNEGCDFSYYEGAKKMPQTPMRKFFGAKTRRLPEWYGIVKSAGFEHYADSDFFDDMSEAVTYLIKKTDVDGIWVFCDFEDPVDPKAVSFLSQQFKTRNVPFYMHSVEQSPKEGLIEICKQTQGAYTISPMKGEAFVKKKAPAEAVGDEEN
jgi:hypothetical protein